MSGDKAIRWSTVGAVSVVALVAGLVSYRHALQVITVHGEPGLIAKAYPLTIDGLIYAASMVLLNARRGLDWPPAGVRGTGPGHRRDPGRERGRRAGLWPGRRDRRAGPAPALVISYELLMLVIRSATAAVQRPGIAAESGAPRWAQDVRKQFGTSSPTSSPERRRAWTASRISAR